MNFDSIPKYCISLKDSERRAYISLEFKKAGINDVCFFDAINKNDLTVPAGSPKIKIDGEYLAKGILACMMSHVSLIKEAKKLNLPCIVIFEDDCIFCDDFQERISYIQKNIPENWDMITLGGHFQRPERLLVPNEDDATKIDNHIYKVHHQGGTYGYIIRNTVYDFVINNCDYNYGMDEFYSDHTYTKFNCYAFVPFLVGCRICVSHITDTVWAYNNIEWFYKQEKIWN